jgi:AraC family transcriptional regulator
MSTSRDRPTQEPEAASSPTTAGTRNSASIDLGSCRISRLTFNPGHLGSHYHERACLTVVLSGSFVETLAGRDLGCGIGSVLVKPPMERHHDRLSGSVQIVIEPADPSWLSAFQKTRVFQDVQHHQSNVIAAIAHRISCELDRGDEATPLAIEGLAFELLANLLRMSAPTGKKPELPVWLARVRDRLESDASPPSYSELVRLADVHPAYLARAFRTHFGMTVGAYLRRVRLEWAAKQLCVSEESISGISVLSGFSDQSHFTRTFRAFFGVTPNQYRRATRAG